MFNTMVISGEDICCSVVFDTLVGVFVFNIRWYVCDVLYAVLYVRVSSFVVRGCAVSRRYIHVYNCDMFSVVNVYVDHLKYCVVCINGRRYVMCNECNELTFYLALCKLLIRTVVKLCTLDVLTLWVSLVS